MIRPVIILALTAGAVIGVQAQHVKGDTEGVKVIDVTASRFKFEPATISVVQGDRVRLHLRSADSTHGIGIKALHVKALIPKAGETIAVEFVADRSGTFEITCSEYCGTGHRAMKGTLIVLARQDDRPE